MNASLTSIVKSYVLIFYFINMYIFEVEGIIFFREKKDTHVSSLLMFSHRQDIILALF